MNVPTKDIRRDSGRSSCKAAKTRISRTRRCGIIRKIKTTPPDCTVTLSECLEDYASEDTKRVGYEIVECELERIPKEKVREIACQNIKDIKSSNCQDFCF